MFDWEGMFSYIYHRYVPEERRSKTIQVGLRKLQFVKITSPPTRETTCWCFLLTSSSTTSIDCIDEVLHPVNHEQHMLNKKIENKINYWCIYFKYKLWFRFLRRFSFAHSVSRLAGKTCWSQMFPRYISPETLPNRFKFDP